MMTRLPRRAVRGQAAALMAATMVLIGLMVSLTLGIGMKVKEKAETQTLADVSAYSGAVATARTFNSIAILNRVEIAHMVSSVATQSLVSYGGYYRAMVWSAREQFQVARDAIAVCPDIPCNWCGRYDGLIASADAEISRINQDWDRFDSDGNRRVDRVRGGAGGVHGAAQSLYASLMNDQLVGLSVSPPLAAAIVQRVDNFSAWQGEMTAPNTVNVVNQRELGIAPDCDPTAPELICDGTAPSEISIKATMGTRWYPFERDATNLSQMVQDALMSNVGLLPANGEAANVANYQGSTRFVDRPFEHAQPGGLGLMAEGMEGELEFEVAAADPTCGTQRLPRRLVQSWVYSTSILNGNDEHFYSYVTRTGATQVIRESQGNHALNATCDPPVTPCGMWPGFFDMSPAHVSPGDKFKHLYGQPKVVSVVQRDYGVRGDKADPWNILSRFTIGQTSVEQIDNNGIRTAAGLNISVQTAIATGLAYYHRKDHWREPPNFFNPYWHATLVSSAIDEEGNPRTGTDLSVVSRNAAFAQDVITRLSQQGFHGWH